MKKIFLWIIPFMLLFPLSPSAMDIYRVKSGDTLWQISNSHGVSLQKVIRANPEIENPNILYVGQKVYIPKANETIYYVKSGDTLWNISRKFGVSLRSILQANPQIRHPSLIFPGEPIFVPAGERQPIPYQKPEKGYDGGQILSQYEKQVIRLTNQERTSRGLQALQVDLQLSKVAGIKARDMRDRGYFAHQSPTYGSPFEMMEQFGISYTYAGENIAAGQRTPQEVVQAWMNSPGHRRNILSPNYTHIGVGFVRGGSYGTYWVQHFIRK